MVLKVKVGQLPSVSMISPKGTRPSLISAWNPLQIPHIKPSRFFNSSCTCSLICGLRKNAVMNLPDPSGSSPPENPPGIAMIWLWAMAFSNASTDSSMSCGVKLRTTKISASPPARSKARAVSYSQLVPGNTGISTWGFTIFADAFAGAAQA